MSMAAILQEHLAKNASGGPHGSHHVYWVPLKIFNQLPITLWKHNRPPDMERVMEIGAHMKKSKRMDGLIYLACVNNQLVCYESNHRREALKHDMPDDTAQILVDVLWNATDEMIKHEFLRINKAVSVPELYVTEEDLGTTLESLMGLVNDFCANYASLRSSTARPQRPNFNRDMLVDEFYRVMKENRIGVEGFAERLTQLNREMSTRDRRRLSPKVIAKCEATGLWLFAWSSHLNTKDME